tara:strand:- start:201 stop:1193 length:993 start_codon:yes stop_codon:yes gene_type:complete
VIDINIWMIIGFLLAGFSVVANDSLQTLGTYISSNRQRTPKSVQMVFVCCITSIVLFLGWYLHQGEPAWGRLESFPVPERFTWAYIIPPIAVLVLTAWGAPVSTSFLVLSSFVPENIGRLLGSSISGYVMAFFLGLAAWGFGIWLLERWIFRRNQDSQEINKIWYVIQWFSTGFLWSMWLVQDLANIFVYLPRNLNFISMGVCTLILCVGLCMLIVIGGGPIQGVLRSKTNTSDLRSASLIDFMFGLCLLFKAFLSSFPLSTTWVFLGLLAGRELALRIRELEQKTVFTNQMYGSLSSVIGSDLGKASVGLIVSLVIALGIQPLISWSAL